MKKISVLLFITCFILSFNIITGGQDIGAEENSGFTGLAVSTEVDAGNVVIPLSELSKAMNMDLSYSKDTGLLSAEKDGDVLYIKSLDEQQELDERGMLLHGYEGDKPYNTFDAKLLISYSAKNAPDSVISTALKLNNEETNSAVIIAHIPIVINGGEGFISTQEIGTSPAIINNESISSILRNNLRLVNKDETLAKDYIPQKLTDLSPKKASTTVSMKINEDAMAALNEMLEAAYADGIKGFIVTSAYRPFEKQNYLYNNKVNLLSKSMSRGAALETAARAVAVPGTSEHQTGLAVDICSNGVSLVRAFGNTAQGKWLNDNSWKYGFVIRYQRDKTEITRIIYEPWHIRYVGLGHAEFMKEKNLCLEEYMQYLKGNRVVSYKAQDGSRYIVQYLEKSGLDESGLALDVPDEYEWSVSNADSDGYLLTIRY